MAQKSDTKDVGKMCRRRRHFREGDNASDRVILHSIVWLSSPYPPSAVAMLQRLLVALPREGAFLFSDVSSLLLIDVGHTLHKTHLGIDNETSDLCTDGADMDSSASQSRAEGGGIIINGPLRS